MEQTKIYPLGTEASGKPMRFPGASGVPDMLAAVGIAKPFNPSAAVGVILDEAADFAPQIAMG